MKLLILLVLLASSTIAYSQTARLNLSPADTTYIFADIKTQQRIVQVRGWAVNDQGHPTVNTRVTFTLVFPSGFVMEKSARTDLMGFARTSFKTNESGSYQLVGRLNSGVQGETEFCVLTTLVNRCQ